jgi:hypothetical protein
MPGWPCFKSLEYRAVWAEKQHFGQVSERGGMTPLILRAGIGDLENVVKRAVAA